MNINGTTEKGALCDLIDATIRRLEGALDSSQYSQLFDSEIVSIIIKWRNGDTLEPSQFSQLVDFASTALAMLLPLKNCDVGTVTEQIDRFQDFCFSHMHYIDEFHGSDCHEDCPIGKMIDKNDKFCDNCKLV